VHGRWDEFRIEQVIVNLLTNALRYGNGRPVEVSIHETDTTVRIDVRDQGRGIDPGDMERIFEPFERGVATGELKGLGLGLYISRQLAASHGGKLTVASEVGKGSTFTLVLPCTDKLTASIVPAASPTAA